MMSVALTQRNHIHRFGLLNQALGCGNLEEIVPGPQGCTGRKPAVQRPEAIAGEHFCRRLFHPRQRSMYQLQGTRRRNLQDLRAVVMTVRTRKHRRQSPTQGQNKPELFSLVLFSSRNCDNYQFRREMKKIGRISHGSARAIEGM